ncbi:MAG TPA: inorganic diphosphatase [Candidatus Nitrosopolaris sp.]|nr:inorganic diphosphatase [Candidatus Nitrosopolaris sp.]
MTHKDTLGAGENAPEEINVIIEIPKDSSIKYELDTTNGLIFVDRILLSAMHYPCNYGSIPETKEEDGDPVDVLVLGNYPIIPMAVVRARPIGVLLTEDEKGHDSKVVAVPLTKIDPSFSTIKEIDDIPEFLRNQISHFFEHYKELEKAKYVKVIGWKGREIAKKQISEAMNRFKSPDLVV